LYQTSKTFVIPHPLYEDKNLVHACVEGPEAGVYYRGVGDISGGHTLIELPDYVKSICKDYTVILTPIYNENNIEKDIILSTSKVKDGKFNVYANVNDKCKFNWVVYGKRLDIDVEPNKQDFRIKGKGPYTFLENN